MRGVTGSQLLLVAALASLINLLPLWIASPGADVLFHYTLIECFARQFWQGDLYPRWCMAANDGLGSPVFLLYFPLPYYITSLVYPLRWLGAGVEDFYSLSVAAATLTAFMTCWCWLRDVVSPGRALLCAALFLFLPYRMEVMVFRTALAELWCIAFLPLVFLYTRRIMQGHYSQWFKLSGAIILALLSHVPVTCIALLGCGLQLLVMRCGLRVWARFMAAVVVAALAVAVYLVPAAHYAQFLHADALAFMRSVWVNSYLSVSEGMSRISVMAGLLVTVLFALGMALLIWPGRARISNPLVRRELAAWLVVIALAFFLMTPPSAPLWKLLYVLSGIMTPWRAQVLLLFAIVYLVAVKMQWLMSDKQMGTWRCDYGALSALLILLSLTMLTTRAPGLESLYKVAMDSMVVNAQEYRSRWTDKEMADREHIIARYQHGKALQKMPHIVKGKGIATIKTWNSQSIILDSQMNTPSLIGLEHFYFPIWSVTMDGAQADIISPQPHTGFIQLSVPPGAHHMVLTRNLAHAIGLPYIAAVFATLLGWTVLAFAAMRHRRRRAAS